ncbi:MAG: acyl-CoA synthetase [Gammaproteobacteria bacterium]
MRRLTDIDDCAEARRAYSPAALWDLFDGDRARMNLAHECLDRHRGRGDAVSVKFADGHLEHYDFDLLADRSSQFAHWLEARGVEPGERIAVILDPGLTFYACLFGAIKRGAIAVPMFTLFGPDGLALRIDDCTPRVAVVHGDPAPLAARFPGLDVISVDDDFEALLDGLPNTYACATAADDLAVFQYTSGTTRALPEAVRHTQRSVVTLMVAALYGVGLRPGDRYFCPSSPAWGHGLWHGTIAPLALGIHTATYAGRFEAAQVYAALDELSIDNLAAAATVYRMLRASGAEARHAVHLRKCSFTGEPLDPDTFDWIARTFGTPPGSMYGTTEVGVILVDFPGMQGHAIRRGALGKPAPGNEVAVIDDAGEPVGPEVLGEIAVKRRGEWFRVKDLGRTDADGYFYHAGRADDVIISAGWTMSAVEIENSLLTHPAVLEAAAIGVPDAVRGQVVKAYVVPRAGQAIDIADVQAHMKSRLSQHEYPRHVEVVAELPKTPAGKINRKVLRDRASTAANQETP